MLAVREFKRSFFDRPAVLAASDAATRRNLSRFGAFVRQRAKTSIRKRRGVAPPGQPPHSHEGSLRRLIYFGYDQGRKSVVIGPALLRRGRGSVPQLLEYGGSVSGTNQRLTSRRHYYHPRPYMRPAFAAELGQLPDLWRNSVKP